jgi:hypothetical protein
VGDPDGFEPAVVRQEPELDVVSLRWVVAEVIDRVEKESSDTSLVIMNPYWSCSS